MDLHTAEAQPSSQGSGWKIALKVIVIAVGLVLGAILGLFGAFYFGLIDIRC
ncbi:hypothetical protein [Dyella terrae]|uniref:hypothetical protein n=1 Tax=Dyella terrae TaxID=522259 RepID=UPI001EFCCB5E|nr:hypothetical protein [Dyella terrae]ULU27624.1 hypothetical protein DYST_04587 [Dyella terrae]